MGGDDSALNATCRMFVEARTAVFVQGYIIIEAVLPSLLTLVVGPWSDVHGRKWPIVSPGRDCTYYGKKIFRLSS